MNFSKINLELWKKVQDELSNTLGLPISTIDMQGNEICLSGRYPFFYELIKKKGSGFLANKRLSVVGDIKEGANLFEYHEGLFGIAYPIVLFNKLFGLMIVDGIRKEEKVDFTKLALTLGVDKDELEYSFEEMPIVDDVESVSKFGGMFIRTIPSIAFTKQQDDRRISELTTLSELIKLMNSSLDLESVLKYIMNFMINNLQAKDCSILVDSEDGEKKYCLKEGARSLHVIEKSVRNKLNETRSYVMIDELSKRFDMNIPEGYNSVVSFPLRVKDDVLGSLNVYGSSVLDLDHYDMEFLSVVANQAAMAVINASKFEEVKELAVVDKLTSVYNRRYFMTLFEKQMEKKEPVSLILTDIDDFGHYNNTHGHPQGDELLKELASIFKNNVRADDVVGRYGGEEFIILLPGLKSSEAAEITKRLKEAVENNQFLGGEQQPQGKLTVSLGLVTSMDDKISMRELIKEADDALYKAKKQGKNRFVHTVMIKNNLKADTIVNHK